MTWDWRRRLLCGRLAGERIRRERAPLGRCSPERTRRRIRLRGYLLGLGGWLLRLWAGVVVSELDADLTGILALASQVVPQVILAAARDNNVTQVDPCLSYQVGLLIVVEDRDLELVVVWGVVNSETNLLVPSCLQVSEEEAHELWSGLRM